MPCNTVLSNAQISKTMTFLSQARALESHPALSPEQRLLVEAAHCLRNSQQPSSFWSKIK